MIILRKKRASSVEQKYIRHRHHDFDFTWNNNYIKKDSIYLLPAL